MPAARPAAMVPFWQEVSVVAAAVEVCTAPLAQVNTLLLWKRAGAAGCRHIHTMMPRGSPKTAGPRCWWVPWGGVWCPRREAAGLMEAQPG